MRVLHVLGSFTFDGAENVAADICMMFKNEYDMAYCSPVGNIQTALSNRNVPFIPISKLSIKELKRAIKTFEPDIIHAHDVRATVLCALVSGRIPVISHLHVNAEDMRKIGLKSILYEMAARKTKHIIAVSESCLQEYRFRSSISSKAEKLTNIIYMPRIEKLLNKDANNYKFDFVYLGRISKPKNPQRVATVAADVLKRCPTAIFGVIGEGNLRDEMKAIFEKEQVMDRVVFTGRLESPYRVLKQSKCMLMCSRFEGTPIAALEAMALGVPIVSTPIDGMVDIVRNEETGYLSSEDEMLVQAVQNLITNKDVHAELSSASINRFKNLNNEVYYREQLKVIYNSALN